MSTDVRTFQPHIYRLEHLGATARGAIKVDDRRMAANLLLEQFFFSICYSDDIKLDKSSRDNII